MNFHRALVLLLGVQAACHRAVPVARPPAPRTVSASTAELDIYRMVVESIYVRSTKGPVAVISTSLDTACVAPMGCPPVRLRWGLDALAQQRAGDSTMFHIANDALMARSADTVALNGIGVGPSMFPVALDSVPRDVADVNQWMAFRNAHPGVTGFARFSPIGFAPLARRASLFVEWECGPTCGHTLAVALQPDSKSGAWTIADILLISSRQVGQTGTP
jgi:hypothetical protein